MTSPKTITVCILTLIAACANPPEPADAVIGSWRTPARLAVRQDCTLDDGTAFRNAWSFDSTGLAVTGAGSDIDLDVHDNCPVVHFTYLTDGWIATAGQACMRASGAMGTLISGQLRTDLFGQLAELDLQWKSTPPGGMCTDTLTVSAAR